MKCSFTMAQLKCVRKLLLPSYWVDNDPNITRYPILTLEACHPQRYKRGQYSPLVWWKSEACRFRPRSCLLPRSRAGLIYKQSCYFMVPCTRAFARSKKLHWIHWYVVSGMCLRRACHLTSPFPRRQRWEVDWVDLRKVRLCKQWKLAWCPRAEAVSLAWPKENYA